MKQTKSTKKQRDIFSRCFERIERRQAFRELMRAFWNLMKIVAATAWALATISFLIVMIFREWLLYIRIVGLIFVILFVIAMICVLFKYLTSYGYQEFDETTKDPDDEINMQKL